MEKVVIGEIGYVRDRIPHNIFKELLNSLKIDEIHSKTTHNNALAGNIEYELGVYNLIPDSFHSYMISLSNQYLRKYFKVDNAQSTGISNRVIDFKIDIIDSWLNYQKKHEFNPIHRHDGNLSYVVWIRIPYKIVDELNHPNCVQSNLPMNSMFQFIPPVPFLPHAIPVSEEMEGEIILFDSSLYHQVYPFFTSDEYRISLAGNLNVMMLSNM